MLEFLPRTSRYGVIFFTILGIKNYSDVVTLTLQRKRDVSRVGETVVKETGATEKSRNTPQFRLSANVTSS